MLAKGVASPFIGEAGRETLSSVLQNGIARGEKATMSRRIEVRNLILGCGYLGSRVARLWLQAGSQVYAMTRSHLRAEQMRAEGLLPIIGDVSDRSSLGQLPTVDTVLYAVGYDAASVASMDAVYAGGLKNVLDALSKSPSRVIYISTTGVYGNAGGDWVNEDTPPNPQRAGGRASLAAEQVLLQHRLGRHSVILRLAGIYGPGRIPRAAMLKAGEPIPAPSEGFLNLIHVDDAARIVLSTEELRQLPRTFIVSDGNPVPRRQYYEELARLIGAPAPRFQSTPSDSPAAARAAANKRMDNSRLMNGLPIKLRYPSYREGLAAIVSAGIGK